MALFAVIEEEIVTNVIIADTKEIAEQVTGKTCVEYEDTSDQPSIGWTHDGTKFIQPVVEVPQDVNIKPTA
jgi:hypothetical protein